MPELGYDERKYEGKENQEVVRSQFSMTGFSEIGGRSSDPSRECDIAYALSNGTEIIFWEIVWLVLRYVYILFIFWILKILNYRKGRCRSSWR